MGHNRSVRMGLLIPAAAASVLLAACGSTSSQGAAAPAGSCAAAQQEFAGDAYSPSLGDVEVAANLAVERPACFDAKTQASARAWLAWWHQPHPSDGTFTGLEGPKFPA